MPKVMRPDVLAEVYKATRLKINDVPTMLLFTDRHLYRAINPLSPRTYFPKPASGNLFSSAASAKLLIPPDGKEHAADPDRRWDLNRFSGLSHNVAIPPSAGLYCVLQQQALINESMHYSGNPGIWALTGKCLLRFKLLRPLLVADLSPHTEGTLRFVRSLGKDMWERMIDPDDASVARGIGLALAHNNNLDGLTVQTVRSSERSKEERGDNLLLFAVPGNPVSGVAIDQAAYYGKTQIPEVFTTDKP